MNTDLTDFYEAFREEGYCTDCWVKDGHDDKCPLHTSGTRVKVVVIPEESDA